MAFRSMDYLPIFLNLKNAHVVVVGGGDVAARKVERLGAAGARVRVVAPRLCSALAQRVATASPEALQHLPEPFAPAHLHDAVLVVAATNDAGVNREVAREADRRRLWVNVVDAPQWCTFVMPAIVDRSPITVAVSSGGAAPVLARQLRARIEAWVAPAYGVLARLAQDLRPRVVDELPDVPSRRRFWEWFCDGPVSELVFSGSGDTAAAMDMAIAALAQPQHFLRGPQVFFVHCPQDSDLLTLRALRLLQSATVVAFAPEGAAAAALARRDAAQVLLAAGDGAALVTLAAKGGQVVRLYDEDGVAEGELQALTAAQLPFHLVPRG